MPPSVAFGLFSSANSTPHAPPASPGVLVRTPASNVSTPSPSLGVRPTTPPSRTVSLRQPQTKPRMTDLDKHIASASCQISMEERFSICLAVAKNLFDSVSCSNGSRSLARPKNGPALSFPPPDTNAHISTSCRNKRPHPPTDHSGEHPEQRRKPLFRIKLPVYCDLSQPTAPTTIAPPGNLQDGEAAPNLDAAASHQHDTQHAKHTNAQEEGTP